MNTFATSATSVDSATAALLDLGPLSWVKGEIDQALQQAGQALQAYADQHASAATTIEAGAEAETEAEAEAGVALLQAAQAHVHQANGALSIVGLAGVTQFTTGLEQVLAALAAAELPWSPQAHALCQQALSATSDYLEDLLAGAPDQPLRLLPLYQALADLRGTTAKPADLFHPDLSVVPPAPLKASPALAPAALAARLKAVRLGFQRGMLKWLKADARGLVEMRNSLVMIAQTQAQPASRSFWWVAQAFLDALIIDGLTVDTAVKRICARIDAQIARLLDGQPVMAGVGEDSDALLREMLYYVATARVEANGNVGADLDAAADKHQQHLHEVRTAYALPALLPARQDASAATAQDTAALRALHNLRETLEVAKETWSRHASQHAAALPQFQQAAEQLAAQAHELGQLDLARLTASISALASMLTQRALAATEEKATAPGGQNSALSLEVATALLLVESALESHAQPGALGVDFAHQVDVMTGRLTALLRGETAASLQTMAVPQLDEMARQAEERLLRTQVVRELLSNLAGIEQKLDGFFRDPAQGAEELPGLAGPLRQTVGALTMLDDMPAVDLLQRCATQVATWAGEDWQDAARVEVAQADFERVANQLSALGFYVEQLAHARSTKVDLANLLQAPAPRQVEAVSPASAESAALAVDAESAADSALSLPDVADVPDAANLTDTAEADTAEPALAAAELAQLAQLEQDEADTAQPEGVVSAAALKPDLQAPSAQALRLAVASSETLDAEMLGIFLEEAHEVLATIAHQLPRLPRLPRLPQSSEQPQDAATLGVVRRAFHTLKGSGRMVGLVDLGEAAWSVEQVLNHWLKQEPAFVTPALQQMLDSAQELFTHWTQALAAGLPDAAATPAANAEAAVLPDANTPTVVALHAACQQLLTAEASAHEAAFSEQVAPAEITEFAETTESVEPVEAEAEAAAEASAGDEAQVMIGELSLSPAVYDIYLAEARSHLAVLLSEQESLRHAPPSRDMLRASHTLGGVSGTVGIRAVNRLGKELEYALERLAEAGQTPDADQQALFVRSIAALQEMVEALAGQRMPAEEGDLLTALAAVQATVPEAGAEGEARLEHDDLPAGQAEPGQDADPDADAGDKAADDDAFADRRHKLRIHDDLDPQLLPLFLEEGDELLHAIGSELRAWREQPDDAAIGPHLQRLLHTLKGSARMAGAMRLGELVHGMETRLMSATRQGKSPLPAFLDTLDEHFDRALSLFDGLAGSAAEAEASPVAAVEAVTKANEASEANKVNETMQPMLPALPALAEMMESGSQRAQLRVRAELVDELINEAGEMAIARGRVETEMRSLKDSLLELTENVIRLRQQLREIEIQAESRMQSQQNQPSLQAAEADFDPLEMDRFTRFQELTRMMAESVNDVTTVQHNLLRNVDNASAALGAQARLNRELSQGLMGVRMLPFNAIDNRLYRIVRQAAKEFDKRVNLDIQGGQIELDRSVLEKMQGPLEHLLRNAVVHGMENRAQRRAAGKAEIGEIVMTLLQQGNEIVIELTDDGAGLDYARIRSKAQELGLLGADEAADEQQLAQFIFVPGFTTAQRLTASAGRGVGMDVVRSETTALGGRIEVHSETGQGCRFRIYLPLTLAVTQALLVRSGNRSYALPSSMIEQVMELRPQAAQEIRAAGGTDWLDKHYPWYSLAHLLDETAASSTSTPLRRHWMVLLKGTDRQIALEVDSVGGNQEIVVKHVGAQLTRVPGITGATVLSDGQIALILNPLVLASREPLAAASGDAATLSQPPTVAASAPVATPMSSGTPPSVATSMSASMPAATVMVVDDSLTVRKIVGRLLTREGYQVVTAKDGVDALEQLAEFVPMAMLVDIEMPRMDGFELTRNVRADARLQQVPIVMITSRIAEKHREHALELGVNAYLGKPYDDAELLALLSDYAAQTEAAATSTPVSP